MSDDATPVSDDHDAAAEAAPAAGGIDLPPAASAEAQSDASHGAESTGDLPPGAIPETADADDPTTGGTTDADISDGGQQSQP
jgi:hypothetical protein